MKQNLLLISGMAHSGTTILQRSLKQHPMVNGPVRETSFLVGKTSSGIKSEVNMLMDRYQNFPVIVEKTPLHLWFYEDLAEVYPSAQMVIIIRDGKDVVASQKERFGRFYSVYRGANHWVDTAEKALRLSMLYPKNVRVIRYEIFVSSFESTMAGIFSFAHLDPRFYDYSAINRTSSESYLSEKHELPMVLNLAKQEDASSLHIDCSDDEIDILPFRKLQVASPLFDGAGKSKSLSSHENSDLKRCTRFMAMMNFMGYLMPE